MKNFKLLPRKYEMVCMRFQSGNTALVLIGEGDAFLVGYNLKKSDILYYKKRFFDGTLHVNEILSVFPAVVSINCESYCVIE